MQESTTGILLAALFIIPTCAGLWRSDDDATAPDEGRMQRLLDRRVAQRRRGKHGKGAARVNYYFLEHEPACNGKDTRFDRRTRGRRAEDTASGDVLLENREHSPPLKTDEGLRLQVEKGMAEVPDLPNRTPARLDVHAPGS